MFLGTEKYPDENTYNRVLAEHGGHSNAFTASEEVGVDDNRVVSCRFVGASVQRESSSQTVYYFDVHPAHLAEMLDIFAQFFIAPLFTESATMRELNAVQNEHSKNLQNDSWRLDLVRRKRRR